MLQLMVGGFNFHITFHCIHLKIQNTMKMEALYFSEMLVPTYRIMQGIKADDHNMVSSHFISFISHSIDHIQMWN
jgi:hypothetical protein